MSHKPELPLTLQSLPPASVLREYDEIILGQGLAGTALAWTLRWRGRRILVIDRDQPGTSSRIAAGLITPVTGQRLVKSWRWDDFWPAARSFYHRVESECGSRFLTPQKIVRLLASDNERQFLTQRRAEEAGVLLNAPAPPLDPDWFRSPGDPVEMNDAGRLDVAAYLDGSRNQFMAASQFLAADIDPARDVIPTASGIELPHLGVRARHLIFCQGFGGVSNPWFPDLRFNPAKGEILTLRIEGLEERRIVQQGVWLIPLEAGLFRVGSTYEWRDLDNIPTRGGRQEICSRLQEFLLASFEVIRHEAAVRPILLHQYPVVGSHPRHPQMACFNGLGSKGALQSPWLASHLAEHLIDGMPIDAQVSLDQYLPPQDLHRLERPRSITSVAQSLIQPFLKAGDMAIDATTGNGHDTVFLAQCVGPTGRVFGFDIQRAAVESTGLRVAHAGLSQVELTLDSHARIAEHLGDRLAGKIAAIMLNLGYLPGGDKAITTEAHSTVQAIRSGLSLLKQGGIMTIVAYPGHAAGETEMRAVLACLELLNPSQFSLSEPYVVPKGRRVAPRLLVVRKTPESGA